MQIYRGTIELLDYVFYATVERGKVYETGAFIHNYALTYALGLVQGETYTYARVTQEPYYLEELTPLNGRLYLTPAAPQQVFHRLIQWNTVREGYAYPGKPPSLGYPDWGFARVLRPGCRFTFYLLATNPLDLPDAPALRGLIDGKTAWIRLGKFPGKARLRLEAADKIAQKEGTFQSGALLNWRDLETDPRVCDVMATSLPTRLLMNANFPEGPYYQAQFQEELIQLPAKMRFLARPPETKRRGKSQ